MPTLEEYADEHCNTDNVQLRNWGEVRSKINEAAISRKFIKCAKGECEVRKCTDELSLISTGEQRAGCTDPIFQPYNFVNMQKRMLNKF